MVLALLKRPFVWLWALVTAPFRWVFGKRRQRRGLFGKIADFAQAQSPRHIIKFERPGSTAPVECLEDEPPPPKKRGFTQRTASTKVQARWRGTKIRRAPAPTRRVRERSDGSQGIHRDVHPLVRDAILARRAIAHCRLREQVGFLIYIAWPLLRVVKKCLRCYLGCVIRALIFVVVQLPMLGRTRRGFKWPLLTAACNAFLTLFWPRLRVIVSNVLRDRVLGIVNELLSEMPNAPIKSLASLECNLGRRAIVVEEAWLSTSYHSYHFLDLHLVCSLEGDTLELVSDLCVDRHNKLLPQLTAVVRGLSFRSERLKVKFGPLSSSLPCFGALQVAFAEAPSINLKANVTALESIPLLVSFSLINSFIEGLVQKLLRNHFQWPRALIVPSKCWAHNLGADPRSDAEWWGDGVRLERQRELVKGTLALNVYDCATSGPMPLDTRTFYVRATVGSTVKEAPLQLNSASQEPQATFSFAMKPDVDNMLVEVRERSLTREMTATTVLDHVVYYAGPGPDHRKRECTKVNDLLLGRATLDHVQSIDSLPPHVKVRRALLLEKKGSSLNAALTKMNTHTLKMGRKMYHAQEEVMQEAGVCCGCRKDKRRHKTSKVAKRTRRRAVSNGALPSKPSFADESTGFRATQLKVGLEWAPSLTLQRHFHHRLLLGVVLCLVLALGRLLYAEIASSWGQVFAHVCGHAVVVFMIGFLTAPFLVTLGMRLLHRVHAADEVVAEDW